MPRTTEWLIEVTGDASKNIGLFLNEHGLSKEETEILDVRCVDGKKRDLYSLRSDLVRKLIKGLRAYPEFKYRFWTRGGHDLEAHPADWLERKRVCKHMEKALQRLDEIVKGK